MAVIKCKMCGGDLNLVESASTAECEFCGSVQTVPNANSEHLQNFYNRANTLRIKSEFDKAERLYEKIIQADSSQAEAYWGLILCKYGVEYVDDPSTHKMIPTCHRASYDSIVADEDYKTAILNADSHQRVIYEEQAREIDQIQKGILALAQKEENYDVFICYKEVDAEGYRTQDSVIANEIYHQLTLEGYKVFYAAITLENKLGSAYESVIFAALNSARVMLVVGTNPQHFSTVWVKNEWSRFLRLMKTDPSKLLIPCYRDMDAYELPEEFAHLQAQDMAKIGFITDVIRGVRKVIQSSEQADGVAPNYGTDARSVTEYGLEKEKRRKDAIYSEGIKIMANGSAQVVNYERAILQFRQISGWRDADQQIAVCEQKIRDIKAKADAARLAIKRRAEIARQKEETARQEEAARKKHRKKRWIFAGIAVAVAIVLNILFVAVIEPAIRYNNALKLMESGQYEQAGDVFVELANNGHRDSREKYYECRYQVAISLMERKDYETATSVLSKIKDYKDSASKLEFCNNAILTDKYQTAVSLMESGQYEQAGYVFAELANNGHRDSQEKYYECRYQVAVSLMERKDYESAMNVFSKLNGYKESNQKIEECKNILYGDRYEAAMALQVAGKDAEAAMLFGGLGDYRDAKDRAKSWWDKNALRETLSAGYYHTVGIKTDGTVVAVGANSYGQSSVMSWNNIVAVSAGYNHTVGLKANGTVIAAGNNSDGKCDVKEWKNIVAISAGPYHTVGLKADGTVVAIGNNKQGQCNVGSWENIVAVSAGEDHTVGLTANGTVVAVGANGYSKCAVSAWENVVAICAAIDGTFGLKADGTIVTKGPAYSSHKENTYKYRVDGWKDILTISVMHNRILGIKTNGTVVTIGGGSVADWKDIVAVGAGYKHSVGLKADGTVVAVGDNDNGQCNVGGWNNIKVPE